MKFAAFNHDFDHRGKKKNQQDQRSKRCPFSSPIAKNHKPDGYLCDAAYISDRRFEREYIRNLVHRQIVMGEMQSAESDPHNRKIPDTNF